MSTVSPVTRLARPLKTPALALRRATLGALLAASLSLTLSTPAPAQSLYDGFYSTCLDLVGEYYDSCSASSGNIVGDFACKWTAGVGIIVCAVVDAAIKAASGIKFPTPALF